MDDNQRKEVRDLLEKLTHSGSSSLDQVKMKEVKNFCRQSDSNVREVYRLVMKYLSKKHAQVRLSSFQVLNELFQRSNQFREHALADFKTLASLVTGTDNSHPLPLPKEAAAQLKKESLLAIREWNQKFGSGYPELRLGFNYLKFNRKVDFDGLVAHSQAERRRRELRDDRRRVILQQRIQEVKLEMEELKKEVGSCLTEMEACFNLLLPRFDLPDIYQSQQEGGRSDVEQLLGDVTAKEQDGSLPAAKRRRTTVSSSCSFVSLESDQASLSDNEEGVEERDETSAVELDSKTEVVEDARDSEQLGELESGRFENNTIMSSEAGQSTSELSGKGLQDSKPQVIAASHCAASAKLSPGGKGEDLDSDSDEEWEDVPPGIDPIGRETRGDLQEHGMFARGLTVPVMIGPRIEIEETEDNSSILSSLRESRQLLLVHFMPSLGRCLEWMSKAGEEASVLAAIDLKSSIRSALSKYDRLNISTHHIEPKSPTPPLQDNRAAIGSAPVITDTQWKFGSDIKGKDVLDPNAELDPTTAHAQLAKLKRKQQESQGSPAVGATSLQTKGEASSSGQNDLPDKHKSENLKSRAPVVPFDMDLYHWEEPSNTVEPRTLAPIGSLHRFWAEEKEVMISQDEQDRLKCRTISFPGRFQPITKSCHALLPSGKLCPRKDRFKENAYTGKCLEIPMF